ncbi:MAG: DUF2779 domain-containing protein [Clostridia bacterium]|nr:DUF2779 domain-containing protein [Clostridia bacterium]
MWQCPRLLWLSKYKPELKPEDASLQARFDEGNVVGDLAMELFGDFTEVTAYKEDGRLDMDKMQTLTKECIANGIENICEASFSYQGLYCAVDILRKKDGGYAIYEVKSSTHAAHIYAVDIAYQKYVLEHCGVNVTGTYLVCIDSSYVRGKDLDIHKLFKVTDMSEEVADEIQNVPGLLKKAEAVYASKTEPTTDIGVHCQDPYECSFWGHCTECLSKPNVFDLYRMNFKDALRFYYEGKASFRDVIFDSRMTNPKQLRQIMHNINDMDDEIDKDGIKEFMGTLSYPLYFLDFETMQPVIPQFEGTRPYQQIPFQYSLHYIEYEGGPLLHKEFLAESGADPRRAIAERLCQDIPKNACVTAYNKGFECGRIKELAGYFDDLSEHLLNIEGNIKDLLTPFQRGYYYNKAMGGTFSIKSVLPALFPKDPSLDYHNLDQVHNGTEAMGIFPKIKDMPLDEAEKTRKNLLAYCKLDTYAMVKVWEKLKEACG